MHLKEALEEFKQFSPATQIVLVVCTLALLMLLVVFPTAGTSILAFLVAIKTLTTR